jgi:hypothetical protein
LTFDVTLHLLCSHDNGSQQQLQATITDSKNQREKKSIMKLWILHYVVQYSHTQKRKSVLCYCQHFLTRTKSFFFYLVSNFLIYFVVFRIQNYCYKWIITAKTKHNRNKTEKTEKTEKVIMYKKERIFFNNLGSPSWVLIV